MAKTKKQKVQKSFTGVRRFGIALTVLLLCAVAVYGGNNRVSVTEYEISSPELPLAYDGYRIVQLSDLHSKTFGKDNETVMERIRALQPDIIAVTGDMVDVSTHTDVDASRRFMEQVAELAPTYYVTGNHEEALSKEVLTDYLAALDSCGVTVLRNERVEINRPDSGLTLTLIGLDDYSLQANILLKLAEESADQFRILLAHEPQFLHDYYAESGVELVLSGHAHGGQIRIPFTHRGLYSPDQGFLPKLTEGIHRDGETDMVISRGLGNSVLPVRLCNHPEVVSVTLHTALAE